MCVFDYPQDYCRKWEIWVCKAVNNTSWLAIVSKTDRPKSFRNHFAIEHFMVYWCSYFAFKIIC